MELLVYKASAGSGKTFTLAVEYIRHLIVNPRAYRQILAVTFTNKATAEMKERILTQLYGIWKNDPESDNYLKAVKEALAHIPEAATLTDEVLRQRAGTALLYMLHDYSRFRVETIDSFFQSVMRHIARELDLSPNLNIELDNEKVLDDAVDSLIEKLTPHSPVLAWLLDYIQERIASDKRWNVSHELKSFGRNIFDESYIERGELLRLKLHDPNMVKLYRDMLRQMEANALAQMKQFHEKFEKILETHALQPDELKGGKNGIGSYFRKLRDGKLSEKDTQNQTLRSCMEDAQNWSNKTSVRKQEIINLAEKELLPLLHEAESLRPGKCITVNSCRLSLQYLNQLQLLNHIDEEVRRQNREHNRFLLSDTHALIHKLVHENDSSFVFEKTGTSIRNVMIDEFQDTSRLQWDNFRILLLEGLSQGADSLIVGDVKQSIYRWRNGDWGILNSLGNDAQTTSPFFALNPSFIKVRTLNTNRRSETHIIRFNNRLFAHAVDYLNELHTDELKEECKPLQQAYADVAQLSPKDDAKGYVKASFLEPDEEHDYSQQTLLALGQEVQRLREEGIQPRDIAILVRKNKNIPPIANYFDKELHIPVVSDEAFRLDASVAVCMLTDALRCLSNPEDSIAAASLAANYRLQIASHIQTETNGTDWHRLFATPAGEQLPAPFVEEKERLRLMPLYELLEELFRIFDMNRIANQDAYLFSFFDAVTEYLKNNSSEIDSFLRFWDETLCAKTIPGGDTEGIRIFSIHKSKGLEFHTVLIPFCDWKMENETNRQLVWCATSVDPYNALDLIPVNYSATMAESIYRKDYLHERLQLWVDNLNLLYVAFTRARKNLILWGKKDQKGTISELLTQVLPRMAEEEGTWDEESALYEYGTLCPSATAEAEKPQLSHNRLTQKPEKCPVRMESLPHHIEFRQSNRSADFIAGTDESESIHRFINRGSLLHTLFSNITTEADIDKAIDRLLFEGVIDSTHSAEEIRTQTQHAFDLPEVKEWYDGSWELYNERDIIWKDNKGLHTKRPDRVMVRGNEMVVVDFKFGKPRRKYHTQVQEYIRLLTQMGYHAGKIKGYLWYVDEDRIEPV